MRKIKFRGKRKDNGEWVYGYYRKYKGRHQIGLNITEEGYYFKWFDVIPETVGQYTGSKDISMNYGRDRMEYLGNKYKNPELAGTNE